MNEQGKYRLIGGIVLVVIILLLIPFFLKDEKKEADVELAPILLDKLDKLHEKAKEAIESLPPEIKKGKIKLPDTSSVTPSSQQKAASLQPLPPSLAKQQAPSSSVVPQQPQPPLAISEPSELSALSTPSKPSKVSAPKPSVQKPATGWVTQVGIFSNKANAQRLIAQLHSRGFHAYMRELTKHASSVRYQVLVGAGDQQRRVAEHRLQKINKSLQALHLKGFVIKV